MRLRLYAPFVAAVFLALPLLLASGSEATPIGPACGSCAGGVFDLTHSAAPIATTATTETWEITYTADLATGPYTGGGSFLESVAIKVAANDTDFVTASLVSAPGGIAEWMEVSGGINAFGCSGEGAGFECARDKPPANAAPVSGGPYTWVWHVEVLTGTLLTGTNEASIKARFVDAMGNKKGPLLSEHITLSETPEPGMALLLAGPLLLLGSRRGIRRP
ncbi:MAG: hypothetical protein ACREI8_04130 [Myxococcota bacterium]